MNVPMAMVLTATLAGSMVARYDAVESKQVAPMLAEVIRFPTYEKNPDAHAAQKAWLAKKAGELGFTVREAGKITEIELPADVAAAPILGLIIHGDVQPADPKAWSFPPFEGRIENGYVLGRGAADDKAPLVQALLAMKVLQESGARRTHTIRLLVGSEEESGATEMKEYLETHAAPDYSLVLDSEFPVVVGEKAWDGLTVTTPIDARGESNVPYRVTELSAGLSPSIVPDRARLTLVWTGGAPKWDRIIRKLTSARVAQGTHITAEPDGDTLRITAFGKAAHSGMNLAAGRNAILALAKATKDLLPPGGARDLLAFADFAGQDLHGASLGITDRDPVWGQYAVNVGTITPDEKDPKKTVLMINVRRIPPRTALQMKAHLDGVVAAFNAKNGASLESGGYFEDEPFSRPLDAPLVQRLMTIYERATGTKAKPAISGGGTYAKRVPNAIAFGMWFPGKPYPGHDVDEKIALDDVHRGTRVLLHALADLATGEKIARPF